MQRWRRVVSPAGQHGMIMGGKRHGPKVPKHGKKWYKDRMPLLWIEHRTNSLQVREEDGTRGADAGSGASPEGARSLARMAAALQRADGCGGGGSGSFRDNTLAMSGARPL